MKEVVQKVYNNWQTDLDKTLPAMKQIPKIFFNDKCQITSIEKNKNIILNKLDTKSGIDWIAENENHIITIAARIQFGDNYRTFTIRKERKTATKTELEKRKEAIENGFLYPLYTCQCYFTNNYNFLAALVTYDGGEIFLFLEAAALVSSLAKSPLLGLLALLALSK